MKIQLTIIFIAAIFFIQCNSKNNNSTNKTHQPPPQTNITMQSEKKLYKSVQFANTHDYSCGMPVTAGVEDTVHYKDKVYGFCSAGCKADFLQHAESYLSKK